MDDITNIKPSNVRKKKQLSMSTIITDDNELLLTDDDGDKIPHIINNEHKHCRKYTEHLLLVDGHDKYDILRKLLQSSQELIYNNQSYYGIKKYCKHSNQASKVKYKFISDNFNIYIMANKSDYLFNLLNELYILVYELAYLQGNQYKLNRNQMIRSFKLAMFLSVSLSVIN